MNICLIVLNWNGWQHTVKGLNTLLPALRDADTRAQLIICDNASSDDSWLHLQEWVAQHFSTSEYVLCALRDLPIQVDDKRVTLLQTGQNLGFAGGMNAGLQHMLRYFQADYVWLLNNDVEIAADALSALRACSQAQPNWGMIGSTILEADQRDTVQCAGGCRYYPLLTLLRTNGQGLSWQQAQALPPQRFDYAQGAALWLKVEAIRHIGLLNEDYFLFYEELDYAQRLRQAGYEIGWCRASRVYHQGSASIGAHSQDPVKLRRATYYETLSTLRYSRHFHARWLWLIVPVRLGLKALALLLRRQFFLFSPLLRAYRDFFWPPDTQHPRL